MQACNECLVLEQRLRSASEDYVNLIVHYDQMMRDDNSEASTLEDAMRKALRRRNAAARLLLAHRGLHEDLSRPKARTAGQL